MWYVARPLRRDNLPTCIVLTTFLQEKLNESIIIMNKTLQVRLQLSLSSLSRSLSDQPQGINIQNMNIELVAQMFKNYQSNALFHLEGKCGQEDQIVRAVAN
jgi:hypothetical protein